MTEEVNCLYFAGTLACNHRGICLEKTAIAPSTHQEQAVTAGSQLVETQKENLLRTNKRQQESMKDAELAGEEKDLEFR